MPLAFESTTHGAVAFGFFNIETDMLLLANRFFFATDFARLVTELGRVTATRHETAIEAWTIERPADIGDLHGAIRGDRLTGFIGEVYRRFPFPAAPEGFRQQPEGCRTQAEIAALIGRWAIVEELTIVVDQPAGAVRLGPVGFTIEGFRELVRYVELGGYPRWRDDAPPSYVAAMARAVAAGPGWVLG